MAANYQNTYFDNPERTPHDKILIEHDDFKKAPIVKEILEGFPESAIIINENRQVIAYNSKILDVISVGSLAEVLGLRIGEILNCVHKDDDPSGCGTTRFCTQCGAANAIKITRKKLASHVEECNITSKVNGQESANNFEVHTTPFNLSGKNYTLFAIRNISDAKNREALERIFFHDVLNTSGAVHGIASLLLEDNYSEENHELLKALLASSEQLVSEIVSQRDLRYAENGNLGVDLREVKANDILSRAFNLYRNHDLAKNKKFKVEYLTHDISFTSDQTQLVRSLGNLIKNALEASDQDGIVKVYISEDNNAVNFNVYNDKVIPPQIQLQIFQRSFSTKNESGRGIGTYSIKLIIEKYLNGEVTFISDNESKTVFTIKIPK